MLALLADEPPPAVLSAPAKPQDALAVSSHDLLQRPAWWAKPGPEDLARFYPREAASRGFDGLVMLTCAPAPTGELRNCQADADGPYAKDFREAALNLAPLFRMRAPPTDGTRISLPIHFSIPANELPRMRVVQPGAREGDVRLNCRIAADGGFENCLVEDAEEPRPDLRDAAIKVAAKIAAPRGLITGVRVILPLHVVPSK
jgi:TonB family protein